MLKGWFNGYSGLLFIYYRGENQLVLSDVNAGFNLGKNTLADTALRIVLKPNKWTQCAASYVQAGLEEGTSILAHLEKTGKVDIYTDAEEVKRIEASGLDPRDYEAGLAAQQQQAPMPQPQPAPMYQYNQQTGTPYYPNPYQMQTPVNGYPYNPPQQRFFDMNMMPKPMPNLPVKQQNLDTNASELKDVLKAIKEEAVASKKQAEAMTTMMAAMTKSLETLAGQFEKTQLVSSKPGSTEDKNENK